MKKSILAILLFSSFSMLAAAPGAVKFSIPAKEVSAIETCQAIKIVYTQSPKTSVTVTAPKRLKDKIAISIENVKLSAKFNSSVNMKLNETVTVFVTAPAVNDFEASSAGSITIAGSLSLPGKKVEIEASSAASFRAPAVDCDKLEVDCSSASSAKIDSCKANTLEVESSSAASLTVNGINATTVKGGVSSAASLKLSGNCVNANLSKSSMGSLNRSSLKTNK